MRTRVLSLFIVFGLIGYSLISQNYLALRSPASGQVSIEEIQEELTKRMSRVPEFVEIRKLAEKHGVKEVYLFGGTASAWAHYVQWDMEREKGINDLQPDRFDYDYTSIFRSNQDMDIVIDAPEEIAVKIENAMKEKFPFFQGKQSVWEVRLLNDARGDKDAILNNPDFLNQHSDSHSTGLIEVFGDGKKTVLDVKEMDAAVPKFLKDVQAKKLHYYYYPKLHRLTKRYLQGDNPEIFSVIRYLTKAFQYELTIEPESLENIKAVIKEFDPEKLDLNQEYVSYWLEKNGPKLFQNAVNIEYAWNKLEELGLRKKLIAVNDNIDEQHSLAWWMNKAPLRSKPVGKGQGKTAQELGIDIVAHETDSFAAYESITKAHDGTPNVLISRSGIAGETAASGDGFYTRIGKEGAKGTGITIRFRLDPLAKENIDFVRRDEHIIVLNKNALTVIPESLQITPIEYFQKLAKGELIFDASDKGVAEKVRRKIVNRINYLDGKIDEIYDVIIKNPSDNWTLYSEWFALEQSTKYPELLVDIVRKGNFDRDVGPMLISQPHWENYYELIEQIIKRGDADIAIIQSENAESFFKNHPRILKLLFDNGNVNQYILNNFRESHWLIDPKLYELLPELLEYLISINKGWLNRNVAEYFLSRSYWKDYPELVERLIKSGKADEELAKRVLSQPHWAGHPELVKQLISNGEYTSRFVAEFVLSQPHWSDHPELVELLIENKELNSLVAKFILSQPYWRRHPQLLKKLAKNKDVHPSIAEYVLSQPDEIGNFELVEHILKSKGSDHRIYEFVVSQPYWRERPELIERLIKNGEVDEFVTRFVLSKEYMKENPYFKDLLRGEKLNVENIRKAITRRSSLLSGTCFEKVNQFIQ